MASRKDSPPTVTSVAELARYLGLSDWTVSRAINGHPEVNIRTRDRVGRAMRELGFQPNPFARGLRGKGSGMVGVCVSGLDIPVLNEKIYHLQESLREHRLRSLLEITRFEKRNELDTVDDFVRIHAEGVVFLYSGMSAEESLRALGKMAAVHVDPRFPQGLPSVSLNRELAMHLLIDHLWGLGHRTFALLGFATSDPWRYPALARYVSDRGGSPARALRPVPTPPGTVPGIQTGRLLARKLVGEGHPATALIAFNDLVAFGALQALRDAGIAVPGRISVTGFDNIEIAAQSSPRLTTIDQNPEAIMHRAAALLVEEIARPKGERGGATHLLIEPLLVVGESTGPSAGRRG